MKQEEIKAVKELLKKIPEDELNKAVGGLSPAAKKAFAMAGILGAGAAVGFVGTWGIQHLKSTNKKNTPTPAAPKVTPPPPAYTLDKFTEEALAEYLKDRSQEENPVALEKDEDLDMIFSEFLSDHEITKNELPLQQFIGLYNAKHPDKPIK